MELIEPFLPIGRHGPFPQRLREQFEGVIWRFRTGSQWREMPEEFGAWQTVYDRFTQWRDVGVFAALMEGMIQPEVLNSSPAAHYVSGHQTVDGVVVATQRHVRVRGADRSADQSWAPITLDLFDIEVQ